MRVGVYDVTAPLCLNELGEADVPRAKVVKFKLSAVGHDLLVTGTKVFKYLSNVVEMNLHIGTHYDLPTTFGYEFDLTKLPITYFIRDAVILDVRGEYGGERPFIRLRDVEDLIDKSVFKGMPKEDRPALIIRTGYSRYWCVDNSKYMSFRGLDRELTEFIAHELEPPILGIDAISVDKSIEYRSLSLYPDVDREFIELIKDQEYLPFLNHDILLRKGVLILENLYLNDVPNYVCRALFIAPPSFKFLLSGGRASYILSAMPCRAFMIHPPPSRESILKDLEELEDLLSIMLVTRKELGD